MTIEAAALAARYALVRWAVVAVAGESANRELDRKGPSFCDHWKKNWDGRRLLFPRVYGAEWQQPQTKTAPCRRLTLKNTPGDWENISRPRMYLALPFLEINQRPRERGKVVLFSRLQGGHLHGWAQLCLEPSENSLLGILLFVEQSRGGCYRSTINKGTGVCSGITWGHSQKLDKAIWWRGRHLVSIRAPKTAKKFTSATRR